MRKKKQRNHNSHMDESWLLPYADMLTLLVALFIVLFAMSEIDTQKYKELTEVFNQEFSGNDGIFEEGDPTPIDTQQNEQQPVEEESEEITEGEQERLMLEALQEEINAYIEENNLSEILATKLTGEGLYITILNEVSFDSGSAEVKEEGKELAEEISEFLYTDPPHQIIISGHTDDVPIKNSDYASNWELSVTRAVNFMTHILTNEKLEPERFSAKGYGEYQPVVPNDSEENRAKNRRVEVLIVPNYDIEGIDEKR
ncbi:flagellar motor protein MotB [Oceanobacillus halotolerans]|uniref:flagellar motor protein MotB n=1 Tax=Oceanobacillus halotolerans TaxID=2663380 RepID=UPI0013DC57E3|nr:flagellar motor protein MotB [Oceanobacillus halotolerans]